MSHPVAATVPLASEVAAWVAGISFSDLPVDVVATTKLRVLDVIGLSLAGSTTPLGRSVRAGVHAMSPEGPSRVWGSGDRTAAPPGVAGRRTGSGVRPGIAARFDDRRARRR